MKYIVIANYDDTCGFNVIANDYQLDKYDELYQKLESIARLETYPLIKIKDMLQDEYDLIVYVENELISVWRKENII